MKRKLIRYESYKDSAVEWIGETPSEWKITRNKDIFEERGTLSDSGTETLLTVSHITGVTRRTEKNVNMFMAETMEGYKMCGKGDLIINTMWAWMGALGTSNEEGICSPAYGVYRPKKNVDYNHRYFDYLYRTPNAINEMTRNSKGIVSSRLRLYPKEFFQIKTSLPNYITQKAIADYLDTNTERIDRKIELLTQKATEYVKFIQSLIYQTVTRGLDKTAVMKGSGVDWIGEVPEHWKVKRLKEISLVQTGNTPSKTVSENYQENGFPWIKPDELFEFIESTNSKEKLSEFGKREAKIIKKGSVLVCCIGSIGKMGIAGVDVATNQQINSVTFKQNVSKDYGKYLIYASKSEMFKKSVGNVVQILNCEKQKNIMYICPPLPEQKAIADYLDTKTVHIDCIVESINNQIDKLKELRKTLINDVVTGKIKVSMEGETG